MKTLPLALGLALLAVPAHAQETLGTDQGNADQPLAPGVEAGPQIVPGEQPLFQPDPNRPEPIAPAPNSGDPGTGVPPTDLTAQAQGQATGGGLGQEVRAVFVNPDGQEIGVAQLVGSPHGLLIGLEVSGLPASSWVAFHIHENGTCDPATGFDSAGGHYTISDTDHGLLVPTGPHSGDMPNQWVGADGVLRSEVFNTFVQLADSGATVRGRSLVIHEQPDDYRSQPSGAAGNRIACAEIPEG